MTNPERDPRLEIFEREAMAHLENLLRTAVHLVGSVGRAEDVVQETFLRAWKHFDSYESGTNCRGWLFRIMFNVVHAERARTVKLSEVPFDESDLGDGHLLGANVPFTPRGIEGRDILEAVDKLTDEHRAVLWLVAVDGFSYRESADILGVPIGTVMSRLHRARLEIRRLLQTERTG
ncbi:MAG: sigma-70 family RNA polymerase sigma factor [Acidobacteria bacterium]|nr:sigma-70 family RNA polymerase sigma factor [Acidobacteriota bacterium]